MSSVVRLRVAGDAGDRRENEPALFGTLHNIRAKDPIPINHGRAFLTNRRVAIQGTNGWADLWLEHLRHVEPLAPRGMVLFFDGVVPYQLALPWPEYHVVLLRFLAWGERPGSSPTGDPLLGGGARGSLGPG